ncbi:hypothetical protein ABK040_002749 [Willaertia magna]
MNHNNIESKSSYSPTKKTCTFHPIHLQPSQSSLTSLIDNKQHYNWSPPQFPISNNNNNYSYFPQSSLPSFQTTTNRIPSSPPTDELLYPNFGLDQRSQHSGSSQHSNNVPPTTMSDNFQILKSQRQVSEVKGNNNNDNNKITKKKRKTKKNKILISTPDLIRCMVLPQTLAAKKLNVSLSTLKRRYYELGIGRWPSMQTTNEEILENHSNIVNYVNKTDATSEEKLSLSFLLNKKNVETTMIDNVSAVILKVAFSQQQSDESRE